MAQMSLTRILSRLKVLKKKIPSEINNCPAVSISKGLDSRKRVYKSSQSIQTITDTIEKSNQSVVDLMEEFYRLNSILLTTNAKTMVTINGQQMSIAEAINKKTTLEFKKLYLRQLKTQNNHANDVINSETNRLDSEIEKAVEVAYGSDSKIEKGQYELIAQARRNEHEARLIDPLDVEKRIKKLEDEIEGFLQEVDFVLSEVNASTLVEV